MDIQSWLPQLTFILFFVAIWLAVTFLPGYISCRAFLAEHFRKAPKIGVRIYGQTGDVIKALAGPAWPAEAPHDIVQR